MIFAGSELLRAHLVAALRVHVQKLKRDGVPVPDELLELAAALSLSSGALRSAQERSLRAAGAGSGDAVQVGSSTTGPPALLDQREAAHRMSVSVATLRRWAANGEIDPVRIGRTVRYRVTDLDKIGRREAS